MHAPGEGIRIGFAAESGIQLQLDPAIYRLAAVKKAAYTFGDRCYVHLSTDDNGHILASLKAKTSLVDPEALAGEFCNEVLDQELREVVAKETETIRDLLMAQAFSATSLIDGLGDDGDYRADPMGICRSHGQESTDPDEPPR